MQRIQTLILALVACMLIAPASMAQSYPAKAVRLVCPFPAGGASDSFLRGMAQELTKKWGQPVLVENRPGANTIIAAETVAKAAPDGYTVLMATDPTLSMNQYLYSKLPYDPVRDFIPVVSLNSVPLILVVSNNLGVETLRDFVALAKAKPKALNYGSFGLGSTPHVQTEDLNERLGIAMTHVPYKGGADVLPAVAANQIQAAILAVAQVAPFVKTNRVKALAMVERRSPLLPDVPTFEEQGVKFEARAWNGLVVPAGTPKAVIDVIARDVAQTISEPQFQQKFLASAGLELFLLMPGQFAEFLEKDRRYYGGHLRRLNVKID